MDRGPVSRGLWRPRLFPNCPQLALSAAETDPAAARVVGISSFTSALSWDSGQREAGTATAEGTVTAAGTGGTAQVSAGPGRRAEAGTEGQRNARSPAGSLLPAKPSPPGLGATSRDSGGGGGACWGPGVGRSLSPLPRPPRAFRCDLTLPHGGHVPGPRLGHSRSPAALGCPFHLSTGVPGGLGGARAGSLGLWPCCGGTGGGGTRGRPGVASPVRTS